ncbi:MAG: hypothetical protein U0228_25330 [Myxococcaceae bacterium]
MRREFVCTLLALTACAPDVSIGEERRLAIRTAVPTADGRWREGGDRTALTRPGDQIVPAAGWFGRSDANGALPTLTSLATTPSTVWSSTMLGTSWVIAGASGDRGFVRALDENDGTQWETPFGADGTTTVVRAIATTNVGELAIAGTEQTGGGAVHGWVALLDAGGSVKWTRHFDSDFQGTVSGFVPLAIAVDPGAPSPVRRQFWLTGTRTRASDVPAYAIQMTFDGDVWDSSPFAINGTGRGLATFDIGLAICVAIDGAVQLAWTQGGAVGGAALSEVRLDETFELATCLAGPGETVELIGTLHRGLDRIPAVATVDRPTRTLQGVKEHPSAKNVTVLGGAHALDGTVTAYGQQLAPVRRWSGALR